MDDPKTCSMRPFRPLLPAKRGFEKPQPAPPEAPPKKRNILACDSCRGKRIKCDGARPTCDACDQRSLTCHYDERTSRHSKEDEVASKRESTVEKLLTLIEAGTEEHAVGLVRSLRAGRAIEAIVSQPEPGAEHATPHLSYDTSGLPTVAPSMRSELGQKKKETEASQAASRGGDAVLQREYDALAKRAATLQEIMDLLRSMPENDAQRLLRELRSASEVDSVLQATKASGHDQPNTEQIHTNSLPPSMHGNFELELSMLYPRAFPDTDHPHNVGLVPGLTDGMADVNIQDPWSSDPVNVWELPRS
ncbi:hypothetical protein P171DRAFT_508211 [Karstenula rhodostoma CBS 690.94]|uniref:Zn(2)-C6 fungal-type domain-containing protein n=1 Tax=Karstenula rhodostoma CBS 690.94 TaxID=1392251 RepID=A0A9P4PSE6_9PLEO|nr:hypothetical protein P171DRAFT_508211 [Karstenula rhodostoma CBS 690.94]